MVLASRANGNMAELMERVKCGMGHMPTCIYMSHMYIYVPNGDYMAEVMERVKGGMGHMPSCIYMSPMFHKPICIKAYVPYENNMAEFVERVKGGMGHVPIYI